MPNPNKLRMNKEQVVVGMTIALYLITADGQLEENANGPLICEALVAGVAITEPKLVPINSMGAGGEINAATMSLASGFRDNVAFVPTDILTFGDDLSPKAEYAVFDPITAEQGTIGEYLTRVLVADNGDFISADTRAPESHGKKVAIPTNALLVPIKVWTRPT